MRVASLNLQKGLHTASKRAGLERWVETWSPDVLLVQEPCAHGRSAPSEVGGYELKGGNTYVSAYLRPGLKSATPEGIHERVQLLDFGAVTLCNAYFPHESRSARASLFRLIAERLRERRSRSAAVFGDFNMAPRPEDGRHGDDEAKQWTGVDERAALQELLEGHDLVDVFAERAPTVEPFTYEKVNRNKRTRFRCDFVLATRSWSEPTKAPLFIDHGTRRGSGRFTDHSGIVFDIPSRGVKASGRVSATEASPTASPQRFFRSKSPVEVVADGRALRRRMEEVARHPVVGLDVETEVYVAAPRLCLVQIAIPGRTFVIDALAIDDLRPIQRVLEDERIVKVIHHAAAERTALGRLGFKVVNVYDTEIRSRETHGGRRGHTLSEVCTREIGAPLDKTMQRSDWTTRPLSTAQLEYAAVDAEVLLLLNAAFEKRMPTNGQALLFVL